MEFNRVVEKRQSIRNFNSAKVGWKEVIKAIDSALQAPSAGNLQTLRFILVSDKDKIKKLADASQQDFVAQAQFAVVVCSDKEQLVRMYDERAEMYSRQQAGAAIEHFLLKIVDLGMASCWVGAFSDRVVKEILQIPEDIDVEAILPIGYERGRTRKKRKANLDSVMYFDKYKNKYMK